MYAHFKGGYLSSATRPVDVNAKHTHDHLHSSEHDLGQQDPCRRSSKLQDSSKLPSMEERISEKVAGALFFRAGLWKTMSGTR